METVGRFAPTPSGRMHLGNIFCALLAWLAARSQGGRMVLRIEDLDTLRTRQEYADKLEEEMAWLGLDWEEGGSKGGPHGPYYQSQCSPIYRQAMEILQQKGLVYPCFCSRAELHAATAPHLADGRYVYPGTCRHLTDAQRAEKAKQKSPALRLAVPDEWVGFEDMLFGPTGENLARTAGDFVLMRSDGVFAYQLAVVVDDLRMGVNQVVRGCDLLDSTPRQIWLAKQLGAKTVPQYGHIPLLVDSEGRRLSKRDGDLCLDGLREKFTAPQLVGKLGALAGLIDRPEPLTAAELAKEFAWKKLPREDIRLPADFSRA